MTDEQLSRLNNVYNNREKAIAENNAGYDKLINDAAVLRDQTNATAEQMQIEQDKIADANLAFQNTLINQGKEQAQKQNKKEQNKALNEYQAYTNPYGYQSEIMGQNNLTNSGVNATKELGAYTAYQNRVATANSSLQSAMTQYDNALLEAQKDNDVAKLVISGGTFNVKPDSKFIKEIASTEERQTGLNKMISLALDSAIKI